MSIKRTDPAPIIVAPYVLASFCLFWFSYTLADSDLWGHIRFGQDILRARSIIQTDSYSYRTQGQTWINHEWLSEVIYAAIYNWSGQRGLIFSKVVIALLIIGLCYAHLRDRGLGPWRSVILLVALSLSLRMGMATVRPQLFTYILFLTLVVIIERAKAGWSYSLSVLPVLFALWVNLHGGVLAGVGFLGIWIVARIVKAAREVTAPAIRRLGAVAGLGLLGLACGCALLLNPHGAELILFLLRTASGPRHDIQEWNPLVLRSQEGYYYLGLLAVGISSLVMSSRPRKPEAVLLLSVAALVPLLARRHYPLFALTLVILAGEHIADSWERLLRNARLDFARNLIIEVAGLALTSTLIVLSLPRLGCILLEPVYPARAVALLKEANVRGNLAVYYDWGEFVLWHLGPEVKVSIDGRRETVYSAKSYWQTIDFQRGTGDWDALLKTTVTDLVLVPRRSATSNLLSRTSGWLRPYEDTFCSLFIRADLPIRGRLEQTVAPDISPDGRGLCFPGSLPPQRITNQLCAR